jgi:hypothetical protein
MNNKRIEEILSAGFGDHDGELGQLTDAERRELTAAKHMKQGLGALRDVPECQLSNERLRNAILASAVQPRRFSAWNLASVAVACVAVAVVAVQTLSLPERSTPVAINDDREVGTVPSGTLGTDNGSTNAAVQTDTKDSETLVAKAGGSRSPATSLENLSVPEAFEPAYRKNESEDDFASIIRDISISAETTSVNVVPPTVSEPEEHEPLVVVDSASVSRNGAARAKEVASYGDVVFGG